MNEKIYMIYDNLQQQTVCGYLRDGHITEDTEGLIILGIWRE